MVQPLLQRFLSDRSQLAIKTSTAALGEGIFRKEFTLPLQTAGLAFHPDGTVTLVGEGRKVDGDSELVLAKVGRIVLELMFPDLRSADEFPVSATVRLSVLLETDRLDLFKDFAKSLYTFAEAYTTRDLKAFLAPETKRVLAAFAGAAKAERLHRREPARDVEEPLALALERLLFGHGVRFEKLVDASFLSPDFENAQKAGAKRAEDERRVAAEREDKERQIRRFLGFLEDPQVKGILEAVPDQRIKGMILAELLRDKNVSITAEELIKKSAGQGEEVVQAILEALQKLMGSVPAVSVESLEAEHAERILVAAGSSVFEFRPGDPEATEHAFPEALRSVRFAGTILGGSKRAIYSLSGSGQVLGYPLPGAKDPKGGVNSIASAGPYLWATHSEYGLARWKSDEPGAPAEMIHAELTSPHKTTRGVQTVGDRIYFAAGPHVYSIDGREPVSFRTGSDHAVTCLVVSGGSVFAGYEDGSIYAWKTAEPETPHLIVRKKERIVTLRLAKIGGIPHLFYSTRDLAVRARALGLNLEIAYESGGASVDFLEASTDFVCASDSTGRKLLLWKSTVPTKPDAEFDIGKRSGKPILDLWMKKSRSGSTP